MSSDSKKLKTEELLGSESLSSAVSKKKPSFEAIVKKLDREGSAVGFRELRNFLLSNFHSLKGDFSALGLMNLVISCDKHAVFADIAAEKTKKEAITRWEMFQKYLQGGEAFEPGPPQEVDEDGEAELVQEDGEGAGSGEDD